MTTEETIRVSLNIGATQIAPVRAEAARENRSLAGQIRHIIDKHNEARGTK